MASYSAPDIEPLAGLDDVIDVADADPDAITFERYTGAILRAYTKTILDREEVGDTHRGFTMQDYEAAKRPSDPTREDLERHIGLWSEVMELIPRNPGDFRRKADTTRSVERFYENLSNIATLNGIWPTQVTARMYNEYAKANPGVVGWRSYANRMVGREHWSSLVKVVCDEVYLQQTRRRQK